MSESTDPKPITIEKSNSSLVVRVESKLLDDSNLKQLSTAIDNAASDGQITLVVLDLVNVQILPSLGLGALVQIASKCKARGQQFKLASVRPQIRQVLTITKMDRILQLADSVTTALNE